MTAAEAERWRINRWIANHLIDWPSSCLHCRKAITGEELSTLVSSGAVAARFHKDCHTEWLIEQEVLARLALVERPGT